MKPKSMNKLIMNSILSVVLALGVGTTSAYASGSTTATATPEPTATATATSTVPATTDSTADQQSTLLMSPGDFFYLLKMVVVKIEIAFTDDGVKQAKLLAVMTEAQIKRAEDLLDEGEAELAVETLEKALADQNQAIEETTSSADQPAVEEDSADQEDEDSSEEQELKAHLSQNLAALTLAMEKVKNPNAKAALARNVEKTLAKLAAIKAESDDSAQPEQDLEDAKVQTTLEVMVEIELENEKASEQEIDDEDSDSDEHDKASQEQQKQQWKAAHEQAKEARKKAHEQQKQQWKAAHEKAKEGKKDHDGHEDHDD